MSYVPSENMSKRSSMALLCSVFQLCTFQDVDLPTTQVRKLEKKRIRDHSSTLNLEPTKEPVVVRTGGLQHL
ncbi:hypothetical protein N665_0424s0013 [Sinapis alba]|nr:hypothetical protein N665_0424s0013 [Sinapis alba]